MLSFDGGAFIMVPIHAVEPAMRVIPSLWLKMAKPPWGFKISFGGQVSIRLFLKGVV